MAKRPTRINFNETLMAQQVHNADVVLSNPDHPQIRTRIARFAAREGLPEDALYALLSSEESSPLQAYFARKIGINASKQSVCERASLAWIQQRVPGIGMQKLPHHGPQAYRFHDRKIRPAHTIHGPMDNRCKSIDFHGRIRTRGAPDIQLYCYHKYTHQSGGAQDNQMEDVVHFLHASNTCTMFHTHMIAIVDGPYYQEYVQRYNGTRMDHLKELAKGRRVHVIQTHELPALVSDITARHAYRYTRNTPCSPTSRSPLISSSPYTHTTPRPVIIGSRRSASSRSGTT